MESFATLGSKNLDKGLELKFELQIGTNVKQWSAFRRYGVIDYSYWSQADTGEVEKILNLKKKKIRFRSCIKSCWFSPFSVYIVEITRTEEFKQCQNDFYVILTLFKLKISFWHHLRQKISFKHHLTPQNLIKAMFNTKKCCFSII